MYNQFYGFSEEPFRINPDPRFIYMTPTHSGAMYSMITGIKERKGITVISGEVGTGKTTLVYALLKDVSEKIKTAFVFHTTTGFQDLLRSILIELGETVTEDNITALIVHFHRYMRQRVARDETVALVIDEAQNLDVKVLENLFRLYIREAPAARLIQILLIGQPELDVKLDAMELQAFRSRVTTRYRIDPLNKKECYEYVHHRLQVAGSADRQVFSPGAIDRIWKFSSGIPRVINTVCDRALVTGFTASQKVIDQKIAADVIRDLHYLKPRRPAGHRKILWRSVTAVMAVAAITALAALFYVTGPRSGIHSTIQERIAPLFKEKPRAISHETREGAVLSFRAKVEKTPASATDKADSAGARPPSDQVVPGAGGTVSSLALQHYGYVNPTVLDLILKSNPRIGDASRTIGNEAVRLPAITDDLLLSQNQNRGYRVYLGTFTDERSVDVFRHHPVLTEKTFRVVPRKVGRGDLWLRVNAEGFETREEGLNAIQTLRRQGLLPAYGGSAL